MNQINLEKLLSQALSGKMDSAGLKLLVAQVYHAQIQQLTDGSTRLQLPQPGGVLQLTLPAGSRSQLQHLLNVPVTNTSTNASTAVLLQFKPLADGNIQLNLQTASASIAIPLTKSTLLQLLKSTLPAQVAPARPEAAVAVKGITPDISLLATLQKHSNGVNLQFAELPAVPLGSKEQQQIKMLLSAKTNQTAVKVVLQLPTTTAKLSIALLITPANQASPIAITLSPETRNTIIQQLVQRINQQPLPTQLVASVLAAQTKPMTMPASELLQLNWSGNSVPTPQLQLVNSKAPVQITVSADQFSRPVQLIQPAGIDDASPLAPTVTQQSTVSNVTQHQLVQQAWRQLLPLLPSQPSTLSSLSELPEPAQHIFRLVRQSQLDSSKVASVPQLQNQLAAALSFQPMQSQATATSSGTLAVAIQLLLGHLLQKPITNAPAATALSRLISQLEPAQAGTVLRQLASHSSTLQQSQLATLENPTQQPLILQLPLQQGSQSQFCQLLLEQREADGKQQESKQLSWQLTMRFDLQHYGAMMVVARLNAEQLSLQFYTEEVIAKQQAERFLPVLKDRCAMQGINVQQAECVLGKIPATLVPRANSLLAIKV